MCCQIENSTDWLDEISKVASVVIAVANLALAYYVFFYNKSQGKIEKQKTNNVEWLKALVLNENLKKLYEFFDDLNTVSLKYKVPGQSMEDRSIIDGEIESRVEEFRQGFIELLLAINEKLYDDVLDKVDTLYSEMSLAASDEGKNLHHTPLFQEEFTTKINNCKTDVIRVLFNYDGA